MAKILIVDDDKNMLGTLERTILQKTGNDSLEIIKATSGKEALKLVKKEQPQVVLMDIKMGTDTEGLTTFAEIKKIVPKQLVIIMTGHGTTDTAIEAMKLGAYDYITKPFDSRKLLELLDSALHASDMMNEVVLIKDAVTTKDINLNVREIIGLSPKMQEVYKKIGQIAGSSVPVLLIGDSGTGKELVARAIYHNSNRNNKPFLAINCAAIPETLLEAELFGYEKGSFTGANERKIGKFEQCNGGTIFLDEIGDMPMSTQVKILRVLQEHELQRVGSTDDEVVKVDVRIISATNKDLKKLIAENKFREDLYYRLNVIQINLPALRERKEDIGDIVSYFLKRFNYEFGKNISEIPKKSMDTLLEYDWPGNVRELENIIKRAVVTTTGKILQLDMSHTADAQTPEKSEAFEEEFFMQVTDPNRSFEDLLDSVSESLLEKLLLMPDDDPNRSNLLGKLEHSLIVKALQKLNDNQVQTARLLGITRNTLRSRIDKFKQE